MIAQVATLRELRVERGISLRELSRLSGVSHSIISRIERNERFTSAPSMKKLADALGVSAKDIDEFKEYFSNEKLR